MPNKALIALLLALILLVAGAFLPKITGAIMDRSDTNQMEFAQVSDIQLEFVQSDVSMDEILGILCKATHDVEVPTDLAVRSSGEIQQLAAQALTHYHDAGFFPHSIDPATQLQTCIPILEYEQSSRRKSNIFWNLSYGPKDGAWALGLILDDRTGAVCGISYVREDQDTGNTAEPLYQDPEAMANTFADIFLDGLGDSFPVSDLAISTDKEMVSATVTWPDTINGDCHLIFYILDNAFYTIAY